MFPKFSDLTTIGMKIQFRPVNEDSECFCLGQSEIARVVTADLCCPQTEAAGTGHPHQHTRTHIHTHPGRDSRCPRSCQGRGCVCCQVFSCCSCCQLAPPLSKQSHAGATWRPSRYRSAGHGAPGLRRHSGCWEAAEGSQGHLQEKGRVEAARAFLPVTCGGAHSAFVWA